MGHKYKPIIYNNVAYVTGTAGSLVLVCETCGQEHFRPAKNYFTNPQWHQCFLCKTQMRPVPIYEWFKWLRLFEMVDLKQPLY